MQNKIRKEKSGPSASFTKGELLCTHCGTPLSEDSPHPPQSSEFAFCCFGCQTVYEILKARGLSRYYELKKNSRSVRKAHPIALGSENFAYLDDPEFKKNYCSSPDRATMEFYLEGVHCIACLWLVEKLPELVSGVQKAELDLGKAIARITIDSSGTFASVAQELNRFGYRPHPIQKDAEADRLQKKEDRSQLIRLGVAGACTGNIMLLAVSLYGGATGGMASLFRWVSFFLFLPVLFYSAVPFYKNAAAALRTKTLSIDVPIVIALVSGSLASLLDLMAAEGPIYFDSLSALVFLLLASRYVLRRIQQGVLNSSHLLHFLSPTLARRLDQKSVTTEEVRAESLKKGDWIEVRPGEVIPADGVVLSGVSLVNMALLTGESTPQIVQKGNPVFSGTVNEESRLVMEVRTSGRETRLGKILQEIEQGNLRKAAIVTLADRISKWFVLGVILLAGGVFLFYFQTAFSVGFSRALALIIVTCPCALALATPLAMSVSLEKAARQGILIKGAETLEKLGQIKTVVLDKTGTVTEGRFEVLNWIEKVQPDSDLREAVVALEARSKHPIAQALVRYLKPNKISPLPEVTDFRETLGKGVSGLVQGHRFEIRSLVLPSPSSPPVLRTRIGIWRDGTLIAEAVLGDQIRHDSQKALDKLNHLGLALFLLSGDSQDSVIQIGDQLGIPACQQMARADPEFKQNMIQNLPRALMVGDGANDALALKSAYVGVAVRGSMEVSLRAADVYLSEAGVMPVAALVEIARETMKVIRRNFLFSLFYNLAGTGAALLGFVNPLFAAVLMPMSALTVFGSSLLGTRNLRSLGRFKQ